MINQHQHQHRHQHRHHGFANSRSNAFFLYVGFALFVCAACSPDFDETPWTVHLIAYGETPEAPLYESVAAYNRFKDAKRDQKTTGQFYLPVLSSDDKVCLIDPGPAPAPSKDENGKDIGQKGFTWFKAPVKLIGDAGWKRDKVTDLILTHAAENTCGNLTQFPGATVYIQDEELIRLRPNEPCKQVLDRLDLDGRLERLDKEEIVLDGVRVIETGKATHGNQVVVVNTKGGVLAFMGPLAPFNENLQYASGPPRSFTRYGAAKSIRSLKRNGWTLIPFNDPSPPAGFVKVSANHWKFVGKRAASQKD